MSVLFVLLGQSPFRYTNRRYRIRVVVICERRRHITYFLGLFHFGKQRERSQQNFIEYFDVVSKKRHANSSESIIVNWRRTHELLKIFAGEYLPFSKIDNRLAEDFRMFILSAPCGGKKSGTVSQNTAATYFSIFKAALKQAFIDDYLTVDLSAKIKGIQEQESRLWFSAE